MTGRERKGDQPGTDGGAEGSETLGSVPRPEQGAAVDENGSDWEATVSASTKLLLRGARDSADAFGPLKSVAGDLCVILENHEVRFPSNVYLRAHRRSRERRRTNRQ